MTAAWDDEVADSAAVSESAAAAEVTDTEDSDVDSAEEVAPASEVLNPVDASDDALSSTADIPDDDRSVPAALFSSCASTLPAVTAFSASAVSAVSAPSSAMTCIGIVDNTVAVVSKTVSILLINLDFIT
ncbi:MAG: hypothetical protein LKJ76_00315 [Lachnospiraceae bacterium]|nr:hypothetical protein [Lachnospiraceae bacterium]